MKVSIRLNILCYLLIIIIVIAFSLIGISYFALDNVLVKSAKKTLSLAAGKAGGQVGCYLQPLSARAAITAKLITGGSITPGATVSFTNYLHDFIADEANIDAAYYADNAGNFYVLQKTPDQRLINRNILQSSSGTKSVVNVYNANMQLLTTSESSSAFIEPQKQLWYKNALEKKHNIWFIFPLLHQGPGNTELGIASVIPVYDKDGNPRGVFGIDTILSSLAPFIKNLDAYPNSVVMILDDTGHVMSAVSAKMDLAAGERMRTVNELSIPWLQASFIIYQQTQKDTFDYNFNGKRFIAVYEKIPDIKSQHQWFIAIVTPTSDIVLPSQVSMLLLMIAACGVALIILVTLKTMTKE